MVQFFNRRKGRLNFNSESVTLANLQFINTQRLLGRVSERTGPVEELMATQIRDLLYSEGTNISIIDGVISATAVSGVSYIPMVFDGFNEDIVYLEGNRKVPNFVTTDEGNFYYVDI